MITQNERERRFRALARHTKAGALADLEAVGKSLVDESDRGMVVIFGSLIEDVLLEETLKRLPNIESAQLDNLTRTGGVLGGWPQRVNTARALGVIDDAAVAELEVLQAMRNACAHSRKPIDFSTPELVEMLALLFGPSGKVLMDIDQREVLRVTFMYAVGSIWATIRRDDSRASGERLSAIFQEQLKAEQAQQQSSPQKPNKRRSQVDSKAPKKKGR